MDRDLGTDDARYTYYTMEPDGSGTTLFNGGDEMASISLDEVPHATLTLSEALQNMGIHIADLTKFYVDVPFTCKEVSDDKTDDTGQDSPELEAFLSEFAVTQKAR